MNVQGMGNLSLPYAAQKNSLNGSGSKTLQRTTNTAEVVSISAEAKALAASELSNIKTTSTPTKWNWLLDAAKNSSKSVADQLAHDFSYATDGVLVTDQSIEHPPLRLASTNEIVTNQDLEYFSQTAKQVTTDRINIYESEKSKGIDPAEIFQNIVKYNLSLPERYQKLAGIST